MWQHFKASLNLTPKEYLGELKGEDHLGNRYFELPADPQGGRRKASRWFESRNPDVLSLEVPPEWQSWLRRTRADPPSQSEIDRNMQMAHQKKANAEKMNAKYGTKTEDESASSYPRYPEYETGAGKGKPK